MNPRGVLYPNALPLLERREPSEAAADLVRWFWISQWNITPGRTSRQELLPFPGLNLVVETEFIGLAGATTTRSHRDLTGAGWAVGALLRPAATSAVTASAATLLDDYVVLDAPSLHDSVADAMTRGRIDIASAAVEDWLVERAGVVSDEALVANRLVAAIEDEPAISSVEQAAAEIGVSVRTAQRIVRRYVGLTPLALIHRRRLQAAAEALRADSTMTIAQIAADLGYADQAHLVREFNSVLGFTPGSYRRTSSRAVD